MSGAGPERYGDHVDFRGGTFHGPVLGKAPAPTALDALPAKAAGFTGRDTELARLLDALDPAAPGAPQAVLVTAVSGLGGIGKTALAVQAAHAARERGWFPGGTLFVDLHGYDDSPATADQALQSLLRALGVEPEHIPATADERAVFYRSMLAQRVRERGAVLVLADNASSSDQVRPLLPGDACHRVLVTSRDRLPQLAARLVPLAPLTAPAAYELLDLALRIADPDDSRVTDDAAAAERLAVLCGHLPLALEIAAALLVEDPGKPVGELVGELAESHDRLDHLDDGERNVRAGFDLSYRRLPASQARLLCLLALAPGPEVGDEVAAVLAGVDTPPAGDLRALARAHLVERGSGRRGWRMHDLVRAFGVGLVARDAELREEGEAARQRVLKFYDRWAYEADRQLRWSSGMPEPERFTDRAAALAWLDRERAGLVAAVQWGREERHVDDALWLAFHLTTYLRFGRYFGDLMTVATTAQEAAQRTGKGWFQAMSWETLGHALRETGRAEEAVAAHARARDLLKADGDREGQSIAWNNMGLALLAAGRAEEAIDAYTQALDLGRVDDPRSVGISLNNLANALRATGRAEEAIDAHTRGLELLGSVGDRPNEAVAWGALGHTMYQVGRTEEAIKAYGKSLEIYQELDDWYGVGRTLSHLAMAHKANGHPTRARTTYLQAADAYTRANAPTEAAEARADATALSEEPEPTDKPAQASPPAHKPASAQPSPPPPNAPDTAEP
ncbi:MULTISPECIES: tetratricopeptide repeat protein [unclassified Streptomyces]|uniref:tetratricopeptide repeat protein n=1 Tax=unclassified Streptomyces TaxID=2593676 RepID=UPI002367160C|nr:MULTISPECIES: tetratricopeptide repeat protein [unclassified Streptomyces]MDF3143879.1 tetratricopeptide repeat protein [Streptomyces sp. T21Q-yed]WDF41356.1 tetratricopeptide repeat protein [Streptomyces sp. T12]